MWLRPLWMGGLAVLVIGLLVAVAPLYVSEQRLRERLDWSLRDRFPVAFAVGGPMTFVGTTIVAEDVVLHPHQSDEIGLAAASMRVEVDPRWLLIGQLKPLSADLVDARLRVGSTQVDLADATVETDGLNGIVLRGHLDDDADAQVSLQLAPRAASNLARSEAWLQEVRLELDVASGSARANLQGTARLYPTPSAALSISLSADGGPIPIAGIDHLPAGSLTGTLSLTPDGMTFSDIETALANVTGLGRIDVDGTTSPRRVTGHFVLDPIDLAPTAPTTRGDVAAIHNALAQLMAVLDPMDVDVTIDSADILASAFGLQVTAPDLAIRPGPSVEINSPLLEVGPVRLADVEANISGATDNDGEITVAQLAPLTADGLSSTGELAVDTGSSGDTITLRLDGGDLDLAAVLAPDVLDRLARPDRPRLSLAARLDHLIIADRAIRGGRLIASDGPGASVLQLRDGRIDQGTLSFSLAADATDLRFGARAEDIPLAEILGAPHVDGRAFVDVEATAPRPSPWTAWQGRAVWLVADTSLPLSAPLDGAAGNTTLPIDELRGVLTASGTLPWRLINVYLQSDRLIAEGSGTFDPETGSITIQLSGEVEGGDDGVNSIGIRISGRSASLFASTIGFGAETSGTNEFAD